MRREGVLAIGLDVESRGALERAAARLGQPFRWSEGLSAGLAALAERGTLVTVLSLDVVGADMNLALRLAGEASVGALVLSTRSPSLGLVVDATRLGAVDVLTEPIDSASAEEVLRACIFAGGRVAVPGPEERPEALVGSSPAMLRVFKEVGKVAASAATVLVTGESGTGKELVARVVHDASKRAAGPFVAVNCAAIPEDLLESELFGHERGAFTGAVARKTGRFERANGGTLFLDEIGDMSLVLQSKILRALQEREIERLGGEERIQVDVRVVAATHRDLGGLISSGEFREDLYYRLAVVRLHLAPLRERGGDLRTLALHYIAVFAQACGRPVRFVSSAALDLLEAHPWPGNVRELRNVLERAVLVGTGDTVLEGEIVLDPPRRAETPGEVLPGYSPRLSMAAVEKLHITQVLAAEGGHLGRAAEVLGMHRNTVSRKAQELGISLER